MHLVAKTVQYATVWDSMQVWNNHIFYDTWFLLLKKNWDNNLLKFK